MSQHDQKQFDEVPRPTSPSVFSDDEPPSSPSPDSHLRPSSPQRTASEQADVGHEEAKDDGAEDSTPPPTPPEDTDTPRQATDNDAAASPSDDESPAASPTGYYSGTTSPPSSSRSTSPARSPPESPTKKPAGPRPQPQSKRASLTSEQRPTDPQSEAPGQASTTGERDTASGTPIEDGGAERQAPPGAAQEAPSAGASPVEEEKVGEAQTSENVAASPEKGDTGSCDLRGSGGDGQRNVEQEEGQRDMGDEAGAKSEGGDAAPDPHTQPRSASPEHEQRGRTLAGEISDPDRETAVEDEAETKSEGGGAAPEAQTPQPRSTSPEHEHDASATVGENDDGAAGGARASAPAPSEAKAGSHHESVEAGVGRNGEMEDQPQVQRPVEKGARDGNPVVGASDEPPTDSQPISKSDTPFNPDANPEQTATESTTGEPEQPGEDSAFTPLKGRRRKPASSNEVEEGEMVKKSGEGEMAEKASGEIAKEEKDIDKGGKEDKGSLRINIALDLEVEVHLTAKVKGDITIGLSS
ncbi:hypothetical protein IAT38_007933 [Cryptococcus sp. DSM 104549]